MTESEQFVTDIQRFAQDIVDTVREPLLILDTALRVQSANRAFYRLFQVTAENTMGRRVYDLGDGQWDIPALRTLLEEIIPKNTAFDDFEVQHTFPNLGPRTMLLNARKVYPPDNHPELLLLAMEDIHERKAMEMDLRQSAERLRQSEAALRAVLESAPLILYAADAEGTVTLSEGTGLVALGLKPGEAVGRSVFEFISGDAENEANTRRALAGEAVSYVAGVYGLSLHTEVRPVRDAAGTVTGIIGVCFDITERVALEERFRVLFEESSEANLLFDERGIIDCNPAAIALLRCSDKAQTLGKHPAELSPEFQPDGRRSDDKLVEMDALANEQGSHGFEWTHRRMDGEEFPVEMTLTPVTLTSGPMMLAVLHDLTERKKAEELIRNYAVVLEFQKQELETANARLEALATTDGLTGLKNHRDFQDRLAEEVGRAARYGTPLSLILLDVDHFKQYNDAFGHPAGDEVLRAVAQVLAQNARETDFVARYGGEEFALILPQTEKDGAAQIAERIRAAVEGHAWPKRDVTASFGIADLRLGEQIGADLLVRADRALYESKEAGRNRVTWDMAAP